MPPALEPQRWRGWWRPAGAPDWQPVVTHTCRAAAEGRALTAAFGGHVAVLVEGKHPGDHPASVRRVLGEGERHTAEEEVSPRAWRSLVRAASRAVS